VLLGVLASEPMQLNGGRYPDGDQRDENGDGALHGVHDGRPVR